MYLKEGAFEEKENGKMGKQKTEKEEEIQMKEIYIKIKEPKRKFIRRPMVQLDMTGKQFDKIVERFK